MSAEHADPPLQHIFVVRARGAPPTISVHNVATDERAELPSTRLLPAQLERWIDAASERAAAPGMHGTSGTT